MAGDEHDRQRDIQAEGQRAAAYYGRLDDQVRAVATNLEVNKRPAPPAQLEALALISTLAQITRIYGNLPVVSELCDKPPGPRVSVVDAEGFEVWPDDTKTGADPVPPFMVFLA